MRVADLPPLAIAPFCIHVLGYVPSGRRADGRVGLGKGDEAGAVMSSRKKIKKNKMKTRKPSGLK